MEEKEIIPTGTPRKTLLEKCAQILSGVFTPFMVPTLTLLLLFFCTYLYILPIVYKLVVLGLVFCFTALMPMLVIYLFQKANGWGIKELEHRKKRFIPYMLTILSYVTCLIAMHRMHLPRYMSGTIVAALFCMVLCTLLNFRWKVSTHVAGSGMLIGGLLAYSLLFNFNPIWYLCITILLAGILGTARIIVKQHTLFEVFAGFMTGMFCGVIGILFI